MGNSISEKDVEDLTLLLIYLTSWDENYKREYGPYPVLRAWKGYEFGILNSLQEKALISSSKGSKSVFLTDKGIEKAKKLVEKFFKIESRKK